MHTRCCYMVQKVDVIDANEVALMVHGAVVNSE